MHNFFHFLPSASVGGAPINVLRLVMNSDASKYKHVVLVPNDNLKYIQKLKEKNIEYKIIPSISVNLFSITKIISIIFKIKINHKNIILVSHGRGASFIIRPIGILLNLNNIHFYRGYTSSYGIKNKFASNYLRYLDAFLCRWGITIAVGSDEYNLIKKDLNPKNLIRIRNPVPRIKWIENKLDFKYHFVFVGRRSYQKGFDHCLEISKCFPEINFLWVGAREKNQFIQEEIPKNLTLSDYMDQDEIFNSSRYIICTSRWEGCSTIISECVISIKPFISLYCDGVTEFKVKNINEKNFFKKIEYMKEFIVKNNYDEQKVIAGELYRHFYEDLNVPKNIKKLYEYTESYIANR